MEYLEHRIAREDAERERKFLEEIGWLGRIIDDNVSYVIFLFLVNSIGCLIGLGIGLML